MEFYRYWTQAQEDGLVLRCTTYVPIHESPSFYWCVPKNRESEALASINRGTGVTDVMRRHSGKRFGKRSKRPRICATREQAFESFKARKQSQLNHAMRNAEMARSILRALKESDVKDWPIVGVSDTKHIPGTLDFVQEYYDFDY